MRLSALVVALAPSLALATPFDGRYDMADCQNPYSDGKVEVQGDAITFYETRCALSNPTAVADMAGATFYDGACSGEGQTWARRMLLSRGIGGELVVIDADGTYIYQPCP
ncbi:hypothetical protein [Rhodobacter ferrooxidans]|uniref:Uncharacterized protein n=1 Tax=Rhodobacter ferrooxidans TaxID=371731 RepID=C8RW56_9RHOB|nr:hypothetical protein [Rhodobacter sp. SW2]EEW26799.1 conserved hypothetical protein [Rhodobacter sp. SW2]